MTGKENFDLISPLDFRYKAKDKELQRKFEEIFSENGRIKYQALVELAFIKALHKKKIVSVKTVKEVEDAVKKVKTEEVYAREKVLKHDVRALVETIKSKMKTKESKRFVHLGMTSYDVVDTANALRFKKASEEILLPLMKDLMNELIKLSMRERKTVQIGRTHGQHAEPITFGLFIASHLDRLGISYNEIKRNKDYLRGKISGSVGAYNALNLMGNAEEIEKLTLKELGLEPCRISTQLIEHEYLLNLMHSFTMTFGVLANMADDLRHLQRSELNEIYEEFEKKQVGSSTMPHKRNPINFENVKSFWKVFMPRMITVYSDQISEHQRDLTNSASQRFYTENFVGLTVSMERMLNTMKKLKVDKNSLKKNFDASSGMIPAEPLYILLGLKGIPDAHEKVRRLTLKKQETGESLIDLALKDKNLKPVLETFSKKELDLLKSPEKYTGIAEKKAVKICNYWKKELKKGF